MPRLTDIFEGLWGPKILIFCILDNQIQKLYEYRTIRNGEKNKCCFSFKIQFILEKGMYGMYIVLIGLNESQHRLCNLGNSGLRSTKMTIYQPKHIYLPNHRLYKSTLHSSPTPASLYRPQIFSHSHSHNQQTSYSYFLPWL